MKRLTAILLAMLLVLSLASSVAMAATSTASVAFTNGSLEFGEVVGLGNMDLDFGSNALPLGAVFYTDTGSTHSLTVLDPDFALNNWQVTGTLTAFSSASPASTFNGTIALKLGSVSDGSVIAAPSTVSIASTGGSANVMQGTNTPTGTFSTSWTGANIELSLNAAAASAVAVAGPANYTATMTWTLTEGP